MPGAAPKPAENLLKQPPAQGNDPRGKAIGLHEVLVFISLDHELMHHDDVAFRQHIHRLQAEVHDSMPMLIDMHEPASTWDAVHPLACRGTYHIQVAKVFDVLILLW